MFNMDFNEKVVCNTNHIDWQESPMKGVLRKPLAREGAETGHATSIVKYQENTHFTAHKHPYGEEIFVLDGIFSDENGDYPQGSYIRNPPNSIHSPYSEKGCTLFVKLNQFSPEDNKTVVINTNTEPWQLGIGKLNVMPLHSFETQHTALVKWPAGEKFQPHRHFGGEEILVLSGEFKDEYGNYPKGTWIRSPHLSSHHPFVEYETIILVKTGHLDLLSH
jgi:anti-sigma factor ChrR (cupin superfamily)